MAEKQDSNDGKEAFFDELNAQDEVASMLEDNEVLD